MRKCDVCLPYPVSVNSLWRPYRGRFVLSERARAYKAKAVALVRAQARSRGVRMFTRPVRLTLQIFPPDNRKRDIDNLVKIVQDTLTTAKLWQDDSLVSELHVFRMGETKQGVCLVKVEEMADD